MKRIILLATSILAFIAPLHAASDFEPRETWPYIYEEFSPGAVRTNGGQLIEDGKYNICLIDGSLHYISDGKVMQADMTSVFTAKIGDDVYVKVWGRMYKVLAESEHGAVLSGLEIDMEALDKVEVGYGVSVSSASKHGLNVMALDSGGNINILNESIKNVEENKAKGKVLPLAETTYLYYHNQLIKANRSEVLGLPGVDKKQAADFIKKEKIKWKKTDSLLKVLEFLDK